VGGESCGLLNDYRSVGLKSTEEDHQVLRLVFPCRDTNRVSVEDNLETLPAVHSVVTAVNYRVIWLCSIDCLKEYVSTTPGSCRSNTHSSHCDLMCLLHTSIESAALFHKLKNKCTFYCSSGRFGVPNLVGARDLPISEILNTGPGTFFNGCWVS